MNPTTKADYIQELTRSGKYLRGRWKYYKEVIRMVQRRKFESCLEVGPAYFPLFHDSDLMDIHHNCQRDVDFIQDCCDPWPITDKKYDVVVALQVWEHLACPVEAFKEACRVSRVVILGLPYKWGRRYGHSRCHWNIDEAKMLKWTRKKPVMSRIIRYSAKKPGPKIVALYES